MGLLLRGVAAALSRDPDGQTLNVGLQVQQDFKEFPKGAAARRRAGQDGERGSRELTQSARMNLEMLST